MRAGDIVLTVPTGNETKGTRIPRVFIKAGQWLKLKIFQNDAPLVPIVHAAISVGTTDVVESVGEGIVMTNLTQDPGRTALIYRCAEENLGVSAAVAANQFFNDRQALDIRGRYNMWNAMLSIFRVSQTETGLMQRINESVAIGNSSFCSQFVANCYEVGNLYMAANLVPPPPPVFALQPNAITPYELAQACEADIRFIFAGFWEDGVEHAL